VTAREHARQSLVMVARFGARLELPERENFSWSINHMLKGPDLAFPARAQMTENGARLLRLQFDNLQHTQFADLIGGSKVHHVLERPESQAACYCFDEAHGELVSRRSASSRSYCD